MFRRPPRLLVWCVVPLLAGLWLQPAAAEDSADSDEPLQWSFVIGRYHLGGRIARSVIGRGEPARNGSKDPR